MKVTDMKLHQAPVIVGCSTIPRRERILSRAAQKIRAEFEAAPTDGGELRRIAPDIWALDKPIGPHTDKTKAGYYVFGVVIINDPGLVLFTDNVIYDLPVGTMYAINGRRIHAALGHNKVVMGQGGMFGFMAWDAPRNTPLAELVEDWPSSLEAWVNGEERVDIS